MWKRSRAALHWLRAESAYRKGDDGGALAHVEEFMRLDGKPMDYHLAFYATLLVVNHRSREAEPLFWKIAAGRVDRGWRVVDSEYAKSYAAYYLALIQRKGEAPDHWTAAQSRPRSRFARLFLPLPPIPLP